jgi:hypothetical protein
MATVARQSPAALPDGWGHAAAFVGPCRLFIVRELDDLHGVEGDLRFALLQELDRRPQVAGDALGSEDEAEPPVAQAACKVALERVQLAGVQGRPGLGGRGRGAASGVAGRAVPGGEVGDHNVGREVAWTHLPQVRGVVEELGERVPVVGILWPGLELDDEDIAGWCPASRSTLPEGRAVSRPTTMSGPSSPRSSTGIRFGACRSTSWSSNSLPAGRSESSKLSAPAFTSILRATATPDR